MNNLQKTTKDAIASSAAGKADLIASPTNGNIVITDSTGQSQDSGKQFTIDPTFSANSDDLIPTQKAILAKIVQSALSSPLSAMDVLDDSASFVATYNNGAAGVGATLTAVSVGTYSADGFTPVLGQTVFFNGRTLPEENGPYTVTTLGTLVTQAVFTRRTDFDEAAEMLAIRFFSIKNGTDYAGSLWYTTNNVTTVGTDPISANETTVDLSGLLVALNNLSDVADQTTARNNLLAAKSGANTDITSVLLNQMGLVVKGATANALTIKLNETLTAARILSIITGDADRTLALTGNTSISGTNTGDQTITLTGDVTGTGTGSFAATISNNVVTNVKAAQMPLTTVKANTTGSTANADDVDITTTFKTALSLTKTDVGLGNVVNLDTSTTANITDSSNKRFVTNAQLTVLGNTSGTNTGDQTSVSGNAGTATALATPRTIGGVSFDGTANIVPQMIQSIDESSDATCFPLFITSSGTQSLQPKNNAGYSYNSSTNTLTVTTFSGGLSGNSTTATALATPRSIYGNNFDGSASLSQIISSAFGGTGNGFSKFSGPTTSEKTFTLPNASSTILTDNSAVSVAQGGTGISSTTAYAVLCGGTTSTGSLQSIASLGTAGQVLTSNGASALPTMQTAGSSTSVKGLHSNLVVSTTGTNANVLTSADEIVVENSSNQYVTLRTVSVTASMTSSGANGLDDSVPQTVTITIASPGVVTLANHGFILNSAVVLGTSGALPTGLTAGTTYYVLNPTTTTFQLSATKGGSTINTTGSQSGVHTVKSVLAVSTWYSKWVIYNGTTTSGLLSSSKTNPVLPSGYTHSACAGWVYTDTTGNKFPTSMLKKDDKSQWVVSAGSNLTALQKPISGVQGDISTPTWVAASLLNFVSPAASRVQGLMMQAGGVMMCAPNNSYGAYNSSTNPPPFSDTRGSNSSAVPFEFALESTNVYYAANAAGNFMAILGWTENL